jgi:hypothetical protein
MGMYTELNIGVAFKEDTPKEIIDAVKYLLCETKEKPCIDHELFGCPRHRMVLTGDSFYFDSISDSKMEYNDIDGQYHLNVRSNLKNYDSEIENFLDFISPYIETDEFIGYMRYEESEKPTLIYIDNGIVKYENLNNGSEY